MDSNHSQSEILPNNQIDFSVPLVIAVTGHRNLLESELPLIRELVRTFLVELSRQYPERGVSLLSALAEGADMLVAEEAKRLGIPLIVPLPMQKEIYRKDFESVELQEKFDQLLSQAVQVHELPLVSGNTLKSITDDAACRSQQYAQLGVFLCAHCHILLALWDGKYDGNLGGTGQVVRFHHDDVMPGYTTESSGSGIVLVDDESDLVYHIVCSRDQEDGQPDDQFAVGDCSWFSLDRNEPRAMEMPESHCRTFGYTNEFCADALKHADKITADTPSLMKGEDCSDFPRGLFAIDQLYRAADWLALHYQKRVNMALQYTHVLAVLMGIMYIAYSDIEYEPMFLYSFLGLFVVAICLYAFGKHRAWHRKHLDYRTLAEGLRVQLFWAAAGVTSGNKSKFTHDTFLQTQDPELGWIRNVMRVAGTECDASNYQSKAGLEFTLREWLGSRDMGQLNYFRSKGAEHASRFQRTERLSKLALWLGIVVVTILIALSSELGDQMREPLIVLMGVMLLFVGVRQSYSHSVADAELIRQYEFMYNIFSSARHRIDSTSDDEEKRRILHILGDAALGEHAQWILMNRERSLDGGEVFQMGS